MSRRDSLKNIKNHKKSYWSKAVYVCICICIYIYIYKTVYDKCWLTVNNHIHTFYLYIILILFTYLHLSIYILYYSYILYYILYIISMWTTWIKWCCTLCASLSVIWTQSGHWACVCVCVCVWGPVVSGERLIVSDASHTLELLSWTHGRRGYSLISSAVLSLMTADVKLNYLTLTAELQESLHNDPKTLLCLGLLQIF